MEKGFYHAHRGYWQTTGEPSEDIRLAYPDGTVEVPLKPKGDYDWDGTEWIHTPPSVEHERGSLPSLTARQFRLGLLQSGHTLNDIDTEIASFADPVEREIAQIEWEYATRIDRKHPLVASISASFGLSSERVDMLWMQALSL